MEKITACSICGYGVLVGALHPDSLDIPDDGTTYTVVHMGCANGEDAAVGQAAPDADLDDERAWVIWR